MHSFDSLKCENIYFELISLVSHLFKQDNQGDYLLNFLLEGGYQFDNITHGYTKLNLKLTPYFKTNIGGKNNIYIFNWQFPYASLS